MSKKIQKSLLTFANADQVKMRVINNFWKIGWVMSTHNTHGIYVLSKIAIKGKYFVLLG